MLIDNKTQIVTRLYESGVITVTNSGAGNRKAVGGKIIGKKQKTFRINKKVCQSTVIRQFNLRQNSIKFLVLTFPKPIKNNYANQCLSKFVENLKENYKLHSYCAVKELHKSGNCHYHIFLDMPYINFSILNRAWCSTFSNKIGFSKNALRSNEKGKSCIVKNIKQAVKYASKYVTKPENYLYNSEYDNITNEQFIDFIQNRLFFCDRSVLSKGYVISNGLMDYFRSVKQVVLICENDYFDIYFLIKFIPSLKKMRSFVPGYCFFCNIY